MPGFTDLLYFGQPNPMQQIANYLSGQPMQPGASSPGAPLPGAGPPAGTMPPAPGGGPAPNPAPGAPGPGQPMAYASTPDQAAANQQLANPLMNLYLQAQQRQVASDQINRGLALIAANHAGNPATARLIMESAAGGGGDAGAMMGNLMQLYQMQQTMAAQQQELAQAPAIAQKLGVPEGYIRAEIMAGRGGELMRSLQPTDLFRNYQQGVEMLVAQGMDRNDAMQTLQPMLMGMQSNPELADYTQQYLAAKRAGTLAQHPELMGGFEHWRATVAAQAAGQREAETNKQEAVKQFSGLNQRLGDYVDALGSVSSDENLDKVIGGNLVQQVIKSGWKNVPGSPEYKLAFDISGLPGLSKNVANAPGTRPGDFATIGANLEDFGKTGMSVDQYQEGVIAPRMRAALSAQANAYAEAGKADQMPTYLRLFADPTYGVTAKLDPEKAKIAKEMIERFGPKAALPKLKEAGIDLGEG